MSHKPIEYFKIILAGKKIEIECNYRVILNQCRDYLADFESPDFIVKASPEDIANEHRSFPEITNHNPGIAVRYADEFTESRVVYKKIADKMLQYNTLLMHGSVVATDNKGYMFTAPSGVGKTTRTRLWMDEYTESKVINGDKPLITVAEKYLLAYGTPWCGEEGWNTNAFVPLKAIFILERANENEPDTIEEIPLGKAIPMLIRQTHQPVDAISMNKTIQLLKAFEGKVKIYGFRSHPTAESIRLAYETARPKDDA